MRPSDEQLERLAASLREIDPSTLQEDPDEGKVRWFQGEGGTELFAWVRPGQPPHHVQLVFARVSVEWSQKDGLKTGTFAQGAATSGGRYDPYLLELERAADPEVCRAALHLLSASKLERELVSPLLQALNDVTNPVP